jgi:hypothetical protein
VATRYFLNHELALFEASEVPPDNGIVERLHVRAALTRKNFLFAGSDAGGDRAAIAFTILSCCRRAGVDAVMLRDRACTSIEHDEDPLEAEPVVRMRKLEDSSQVLRPVLLAPALGRPRDVPCWGAARL